jgi:hypothetical protein
MRFSPASSASSISDDTFAGRCGDGSPPCSIRTSHSSAWLAVEPQLTAIAILGRLSERHPDQFGKPQHSIVQRLLKVLRTKAACLDSRRRTSGRSLQGIRSRSIVCRRVVSRVVAANGLCRMAANFSNDTGKVIVAGDHYDPGASIV